MTDAVFTPAAAALDLSVVEALVRSPLGDIRITLRPADDASPDGRQGGGLQTSIRLDFGDEVSRAGHAADMGRVVAELARAVRGLGAPVEAARPAANPTIGPWLAERTEADPGARTLIRYLHQDYVAWCDRRALVAMNVREFGLALSERGFDHAGNIHQGGFRGRARGGLRIRLGDAAPIAAPVASQAGL